MLLELGPLRGCACSLSLVLLVAVLGPPLHMAQSSFAYSVKFDQGLKVHEKGEHKQTVVGMTEVNGSCHGPGCSRSRRVTGSYGRSTGIEDLVDTSREHGRSAVSMETMDSYGLTCKGGPSHMRGGPGTATRRTKLKEQAQPRRGPSSRSMQMVTTQGLERQESKELTPGHEEEEQCRRSRHHSGGTRVPNKQQDSKEEEQCRRSRHSSRGTGVPSKQERPLNSTR
ncbi:uncharacterized protein UHOR_14021 [Ustilago hordei]|uniref:Uncharacterized protein n=1 Tax=Ustilago hordei TaxID=120017 RepID=I2FSP7_USTHO|nr:uncharacterized protein UHOR_14021 [Ustilago hordei]